MRFISDGTVGAYSFLSVSYLALSAYSVYRVVKLHRACKSLSLGKLFAVCCLVTASLRCMVMTCVMGLDYLDSHQIAFDDADAAIPLPLTRANTSSYGSPSPSLFVQNLVTSTLSIGDEAYLQTPDFFSKALLVLFDFPDFSIVSAYALLTIVWCEALTQTKYHWLNTRELKRSWLKGYFVFQVLLYGTQCGLYALLFVPSIDQAFLSRLIYSALAVVNLAVPAVWLFIATNITCQLSGFPRGSRAAVERWRAITKLGVVWTVARVLWGTLSLYPFLDDWAIHQRIRDGLYSIELVALFYATEIIPIAMALSATSMRHIIGSSNSSSIGTRGGEPAFLRSDSYQKESNHYGQISSAVMGEGRVGASSSSSSSAPTASKARGSGDANRLNNESSSSLHCIFVNAAADR